MKNNIKKIIFSTAPLVIALLILELVVRIIYFNYAPDVNAPLALLWSYNKIEERVILMKAEKIVEEEVEELPPAQEMLDSLYSEDGQDLLTQFKEEYENNFKKLVEEAANVNSKLAILYFPADDYHSSNLIEPNRDFLEYLSNKYSVDLIDLTEEFKQHPSENVTLLPFDGHLSRFGNYLVAQNIAQYLETNKYYNSDQEPTEDAFGDLIPKEESIWDQDGHMPYLVKVNNQGFRMNQDLEESKKKQRVLILGDSLTFGVYLNNLDTYPEILNKDNTEQEVINSGVIGYTITDETNLFSEQGKNLAPDITILQVADNDLYGLFAFKKNNYDRQGQEYQPTQLEEEFINKLKNK